MLGRKEIDKLTDKIIGIAIEIHKTIGPGFIERIYEKALAYEFAQNKLKYEQQQAIKIKYKNLSC